MQAALPVNIDSSHAIAGSDEDRRKIAEAIEASGGVEQLDELILGQLFNWMHEKWMGATFECEEISVGAHVTAPCTHCNGDRYAATVVAQLPGGKCEVEWHDGDKKDSCKNLPELVKIPGEPDHAAEARDRAALESWG